jgi:hypothetical protein
MLWVINVRRLYIQKYVVLNLFLVNIKRLLEHHGHFLDSDGFQTYFSQYQQLSIRLDVSYFQIYIHNMNGIFLDIDFIA